MTPPRQNPPQPNANPIKHGFDWAPSGIPLVQKDLPVSTKVEVDANGNATYMIQLDLSFLLAGSGAGRAAARLGRSAASHLGGAAAKTLAKGAAAGAAHGIVPASSPSRLDALARGLESLFGPAPAWLVDLANAIGI